MKQKKKNSRIYCWSREIWINVDQSKPADIFIESYIDGKNAAIDVTVTSPIQNKTLNRATTDVFVAAKLQETVKLKKYDQIIDSDNFEYIPLVFEAFGGIPEKSKNILKRLSADLLFKTRLDINVIYNHIKRMIVIKIWKSNFDAIMNRIDSNNGDEEHLIINQFNLFYINLLFILFLFL